MLKRSFICILLLVLLCTVTFAAGAEEEEQFHLELVVTATKIPQEITEAPGMVYTIDQEDIEANQNKTVADLLTDEGFTISTYGGEANQATVRLDSSSAEQTLIMVDGIPLHGGTMGIIDLSYFPVTGTEKIEVVKGPLSALYGANALGGVVNIIPNLTGKPGLGFTLSGGSYLSGRTGLTLIRENWGIAMGGSTTDGHRPHSATTGHYLAVQYNPLDTPDGFLKVYGSYRTKSAQIPQDPFWLTYGNQDDQNFFLSLSGKKEFDHSSLEAKLSYQTWDNFYETLDENLIVTEQDRHLTSRLGTDLTYRLERGTHRFLAGLDFNYDTTDSTATGFHRRRGIGLYLQDLWDLNDYLLLHSGVRWDRIGDFQPALSPRLGLTWFINDQFNLGVNYGTAFRIPTMNDMYGKWGGNPDLKPEQGKKVELTTSWQKGALTFSANVFRSLLRDGIVWADPDGDGTFLPENVEKLKTAGFSLRSAYNWGPIITGLNYTYLDQRGWDPLNAGFTRDLNFFGQHQVNLKVQAKWGRFRIKTRGQVVAARRDERFLDSTMPDYFLLSTALDYQLDEHCTLNLALENLTDTKYEIQYGYPMPGRCFRLNLKIRY